MAVEPSVEVALLNGARNILHRTVLGWSLGVLVLLTGGLPVAAQRDPDIDKRDSGENQQISAVDEYRVKTAFLYNFSKFVGWPKRVQSSADRSFVVAIVGNDPFALVVERELAGKNIGGRPILVQRSEQLSEVLDARVVYCSPDDLRDLSSTRRARLRRNGVLTIGDGREFVSAGGVLSWEIPGEKLEFVVNLGASREAGLEIRSNLLGLAVAVVNR